MKDADQGDPWRGVDLNKKLTIEELGWLEEREWMAIGFSDELIPFIMEEDGRITGLLTSYMERILEPLGIGIRYVQVEKEQVDSMLSDGTLDGYLVILSSNLTEGHAYSAPLIPVKGKLFLRNLPDSPGREELIGKRILRFSSEGLSLEGVSLDQYNEIQEAGSMEEARELLEKGSYDGIAGSEAAVWSLLQRTGKEKEYKNSSDVKMDLLQNHKTHIIQMEHLESKSKNSISDSALISKSLEDAKITYNREKNEVEEYEKTINSLKLLTNDLINKKNSISKVFSEEDSELRSLDMENVRLNELLNSKQRELDSLNSLIEKNSKLLNDLESEIAFNEKLKNQMIDDNTSLDVEVNKLSEQIVIVKDKIYVCSNQEDTVKKALAQKREDYRNLEKDLISLQAKISKLDSDKAKIDFQKNSIIEKIRDDYSMELDDAIKLLDETIDTSKTKIDNLKKSIQDLGNINVDAIEQYNVIKERYDFYKEQKEDLEDSIKQINQIIISLEQNMVVEFEKSFCEINSKFDEVFKILFGGGSGKLILTDESNMLASDIDINVQPPGKKVKSISVLSGGEKALSAIAILFSILMRKPVPFCVLDEIDAPLDDANIIRFITLLNILSKQTQFITITHRRGTMEASEYIYGVTMQDKGVSKIISLKLEEAKEYIEN